MKKSIIGLIWGESTLKVMAILYDSVITAFLLQLGLKNTQIGLIWSVVLLTQMLFDYPTGSFADRYGRLKIFTVGMVLTGSAIVMIAYSINVIMLYMSAILMGIGESQISGTLFPWFINSLDMSENLQEKEEYILKSNGQVQYSANIIGILTGFVISFLNLDYKFMLVLAGTFQAINGILIYFSFKDNKSTEVNLIKIGKKSFYIFLKEYKLWVYTLAMTVHYSFYSIYLFIWQPRANLLGVVGSKLTGINSIYLLCLVVSGLVIKYKKEIKNYLYILCTILIPISLIIIYHSQSMTLYLIGIILLGFSNGMIAPQIMSTVHYFITDEVRSSVISLVSSLSSVFLIFLQVIIGKILDIKGNFYLEILCVLFGIIYIICIILILKWIRKNNCTI
ncbi:MFS transporter [Fusobacterium simiae]|nr:MULTISPECIES: MFS transporter [Fusobacterium]MDC7954585.1 MFS transporter [Fusobacterium simiae]